MYGLFFQILPEINSIQLRSDLQSKRLDIYLTIPGSH